MANRDYLSTCILFLALSGASSASLAAASASSAPSPKSFVEKAAQDGMTEVELGKVALQKSSDPQIRSFAQRMVQDHGKANDELASIAKSKGIMAPKSLDSKHQAMVKNLSGKSGSAFDQEYSKHMNDDHSQAIALFESESRAPDQDLAQFASKTLPTLKEHKQLASELASAKNGSVPGGR